AVTVSAGGAGAASVNVTVSVTYAENTMSGSLLATIDDSTVTSTSGSVTVDAFADNLIEADGVAVGVSVGGAGGVSINVAASAVLATAVLTNVVEASIIDGSNVAANSVSATATDESTVDATLVAASVSIGGAGAVSVNASIAVSVAQVDFGTNTRALISGSKVLARTGDVSLTALSTGSVDVDAVAVGVSFGASGGVSGSVAAAGAIAIINSTNLVSASIVADSDVDATLGSVILSATDETLFTSDVDSVSVSGAISGGAGIALSIAYAQSNTSIDGTVRTEINDSDVDAGTDIMLTSLADGVIDADGVGVSVSLSAAVGFSLSGAGAGVIITNVIGQDVIAEIGDSEAAEGQGATAGNDVLLSATDSIKSTADASAATVSGAASFAAGALAISAARASNS
ncbi:hypothetical protein EOD04_34145, partial [Mesorhizobium sp. M2C.T.Ca.TU.009.01.2.1]